MELPETLNIHLSPKLDFTHFFRVRFSMNTLYTKKENKGFSHVEEFHNNDMIEALKKAKAYYNKKYLELKMRGHFFDHSFIAPDDFDPNKMQAAYSVTLLYVYSGFEEWEYYIDEGDFDEGDFEEFMAILASQCDYRESELFEVIDILGIEELKQIKHINFVQQTS